MSIVGPRPERPEIEEKIEKELPEFALRLQVKAGLTGYAQVYAINELDAQGYEFELLGASESGNSIIRFSVDKYRSTDEDDDYSDTVVPFQVAYAVSIHKAQGLEYRSVKIVITNEVEERITHNIFYTAITRAKEKLKIYWSPETERNVLDKLEVRDSKRDANLLRQLYSL